MKTQLMNILLNWQPRRGAFVSWNIETLARAVKVHVHADDYESGRWVNYELLGKKQDELGDAAEYCLRCVNRNEDQIFRWRERYITDVITVLEEWRTGISLPISPYTKRRSAHHQSIREWALACHYGHVRMELREDGRTAVKYVSIAEIDVAKTDIFTDEARGCIERLCRRVATKQQKPPEAAEECPATTSNG